jgi:Ca-activated chloride channel family protein
VVSALLYLFAASSGLGGLFTDAREFITAVRFARPLALLLLLLLPLLGMLNYWASQRRLAALAAIGRPAAVTGQLTHPQLRSGWVRRLLGLAYPIAWVLLVLGIAGPRWGKSDEAGVAVGRDLVIVIDLSRSMRADDMSNSQNHTRWQAARAGALDLLQAVERRGGHRVAVVVFAAKPKLMCPLTTDYEHVRAVLEDIDGEFPPPEIGPGLDPNITSGTRIGAALVAAVQAHDERFPGSQDIILISDGDDPLAAEKEWLRGADAARAANIPVHTVGVGDPTQPFIFTVGLETPELVNAQLQEEPLKTDIAERTRGYYLPARRDVPALGEFFRTRVEPNPTREVSDDKIPQPKERYPWFLAPALLLFLVGWLRGR